MERNLSTTVINHLPSPSNFSRYRRDGTAPCGPVGGGGRGSGGDGRGPDGGAAVLSGIYRIPLHSAAACRSDANVVGLPQSVCSAVEGLGKKGLHPTRCR